jgi:hypothetical protein
MYEYIFIIHHAFLGIMTNYSSLNEMLLIGLVHVEYEAHEAATLLMLEALLGS